MKLQHLHIDNYKNLKNFDIGFSDTNVTALIGTNGSGKSNIIEVLSKVFYNAFNTPKSVPLPQNEIEYVCTYIVNHKQAKTSFEFTGKTYDANGRLQSIIGSKNVVDKSLPHQIICMYSGEEERLWNDFYYELYKSYISCVKGNKLLQQNMLYINHYHWAICLLLLAVYKQESFLSLHFSNIDFVDISFADKDISKYEENEVIELVKKLGFSKNKVSRISLKDITSFFEANYTVQDIFNYLVLASLPKEDKLITKIDIHFEDSYCLTELSEGEKKLITLTAIYELLVDNETLVLLDEPDTYVHEGKKHLIYELVNKYADIGICTVLTTHSPTLTNMFTNEQLRALVNKGDAIDILSENKKQAVNRLTNGIWCAEAQCILFESQCDLLLVEGKGDTRYIKNAIKYFQSRDEKYKKLNLFVLPFGGTGNCADYIQNIIEAGIVNRKIIALFDADGSGRNKFSELVGREGNDYTDRIYAINNFIKALLLPKPTEDKNAEFMIEDYFDLSGYEKERDQRYGVCKGAKAKSDFKYSAKDYVADHCDEIGYAGFEILCNKLIEVIDSF